MNLVDLAIVLLVIGSIFRGHHIGLVRQVGSTIGFVAGLFLGSWIGSIIVRHETDATNKSLTSLLATLLVSFMLMTLGEAIGVRLKVKLIYKNALNKFDGWLGSIMAIATLLFAIWLASAILVLGPVGGLQQSLKQSHIISTLDSSLPPATKILGSLNTLIDPNGFP